MVAKSRSLVLVTGAPRSGTTTVGDILSLAADAEYIYEPMNFHSGDKIISRYFEIPGTANFSENDFKDLVNRIAALQLRLKLGLWPEDTGLRRIAKFFVGGRSRTSYLQAKLKRNLNVIIWKDPIAALSVPCLLNHFDIPIVVTYRPPEAVAASFVRMKWAFDLRDILPRAQQAGIIANVDEFEGLDWDNSAINAAIMWRIIYGLLLRLARQNKRLMVVDIGEIIDNPIEVYQKIFNRVGLSMTDHVKAQIVNQYSSISTKKKAVPSGHAHTKERDIKAVNVYWQSVLDNETVDLVQRIAEPVLNEELPLKAVS